MRLLFDKSFREICSWIGGKYAETKFQKSIKRDIRRIAAELNLDTKLHTILVKGVYSPTFMGVELETHNKKLICIFSLSPFRSESCKIKHELMHVADWLNPAFKWDMKLAEKCKRSSLWKIVAVLWDINIDSRIDERIMDLKEERIDELTNILEKEGISSGEIRKVFNKVWTKVVIPFPTLCRIAYKLRRGANL